MRRTRQPEPNSQPPETPPAPDRAARARLEKWFFFLGLLGLLALLFRNVLMPGQTLFSMDDNAGILRYQQSLFPEALLGGWYDLVRVGTPMSMLLSIFFTPLLWLLPTLTAIWALYAIYMLLGSVFLGLYLRERGCAWPAALLGSLTAFFVGSNFTLIYAGHLQKFAVLMHAGLYLWLIELAARTRRARFAMLAGGALAFPFLHQADVALFMALFLGAYTIYVCFRERLFTKAFILKLALPMATMTLLLLIYPLQLLHGTHIKGVAALEEESPQRKWDMATQWSWPPDEIIDTVAPGYFGWRSAEPAGPYYGRVGRSPDWMPQQYRLPNHKTESNYIGLLPVIFALLALWSAWMRRRSEKTIAKDVFFWASAALVALLLSFGRYAPFYALFYKLPFASSIRNPNKFVQIFQFALAIMAAYGLDWIFWPAFHEKPGAAGRKQLKATAIASLALSGIFALAFLSSLAQSSGVASAFVLQGWPQAAAEAIASVRSQALGHATLLGFILSGLLLAMLFMPAKHHLKTVAWIIALVVAADALILARHYLKTTGTAYYKENELCRVLKAGDPLQRSLMTHQESFYNNLLTFYFPFHHLCTWNVPQMPREPAEYRNLRVALQSDLNMRLWQFCAIGNILTPVAFYEQMASSNPAWRENLELVMAYQVARDPQSEFRIVPARPDDSSAQGVYRFKQAAPRFALLGNWEVMENEKALALIASTNFTPLSCALVTLPEQIDMPQASSLTQAETEIISYRSGHVRLKTRTDAPAILRFAEKFDHGWRARVNGRPAPILHVDYLFQGVLVEPGESEITFFYRSDTPTLWLQAAALAAWLGLALFALARAAANALRGQ